MPFWSELFAYVIYFRYGGVQTFTQYGTGRGPIWLGNVHCVGNEMSIADCTHDGWRYHGCLRSNEVSVVCFTSRTVRELHGMVT